MKTVHKIYALLLAAAMLLSLAACGSNGPGMDAQAEGADAVAAEPEATPTPRPEPDAAGVPRYLTLDTTATDFGTITIPHFSTHNLDTDTAREANAMFEKIRDDIIASVEASKTAGGSGDSNTALCATQTAAHEGSLSVLVSYRPDAASNVQRFEALTFDTENGYVISPDRVISEIGEHSRTETENALTFYANKTLGESIRQQTVYECAASGAVPQGLDGPFLSTEQQYAMLNDYRNDQLVGAETEAEEEDNTNSWDSWNNTQTYNDQTNGNTWDTTDNTEDDADEEPAINWDDLPRSPTAYVDAEGQLFVRAAIPTGAESVANAMVGIGSDDAETARLNPQNPNGIDFGLGIIPTDAAMGLAAMAMGLDGDNTDEEGTQYRLTIDSTAMLSATEGGHNEPAYVVTVFTGNGDTSRIHVAAYYAIGVYSAQVWQMDINAGKWVAQQPGASYLVDAVADGESRDAMAVVQHKPNAYELWMHPPVAEINLTNYAYTQGDVTSMLVYAVKDNTTIHFAGGWVNYDNEFAPNNDYNEFELNAGESILVQCRLPETPAQAVIADWRRDEGILPLFTSEEHPVSTFQYVTATPEEPEESEESDEVDSEDTAESGAQSNSWSGSESTATNW